VHIRGTQWYCNSMWRQCESVFNLPRHMHIFLQENAFFCRVSRMIHKLYTNDIPTAAVAYDSVLDEISMYVNPGFMSKLADNEVNGVLLHELNHIVFEHITSRVLDPKEHWFIATDLANNSFILSCVNPRDSSPSIALPKGVLIPGQRPQNPDGSEVKQEDVSWLGSLIATLPPLKSSEWYFNVILEESKKHKDDGMSGLGPWDVHSMWDAVPSDTKEYVRSKVKTIIEKAVYEADSLSDGWGNIPFDIRDAIRKSVSRLIDWRAVLRNFVGSLNRSTRSTSFKKINKRYPLIHPGVKHGHDARLLVAVDESASMSNERLSLFFGELTNYTRKTSVTILPFDCSCKIEDAFEWKKGTVPAITRTKCGGTSFDAPTDVVNDPRYRGMFDGMLVYTDGQGAKPGPSRIKRGWVLGEGCNLAFETDELRVLLDRNRQSGCAW